MAQLELFCPLFSAQLTYHDIFAVLQLAFVGCAIIGAVVLYKVFQGSSVEGAIRETKGSIKGGYKEAKGQVKVRI